MPCLRRRTPPPVCHLRTWTELGRSRWLNERCECMITVQSSSHAGPLHSRLNNIFALLPARSIDLLTFSNITHRHLRDQHKFVSRHAHTVPEQTYMLCRNFQFLAQTIIRRSPRLVLHYVKFTVFSPDLRFSGLKLKLKRSDKNWMRCSTRNHRMIVAKNLLAICQCSW